MTSRRTTETDRSEARGPAHGAESWLDEHGDVLYRYARSRVRDRELAEDLVQDTLLAALQSHDRFEGRSSVRTWLLSILRHKIVDHYRGAAEQLAANEPDSAGRLGHDPVGRRYVSSHGLRKSAVACWKTPHHALEAREFRDVLDGCLGRLPRSLFSVFVLRELEGLEVSELRKVLRVSEVNLRVRLHRARLLLRECLERHWFADEAQGSRRTR